MKLIKVKGSGNIKDFEIGKYQVTQKEYEEVMGYNPSEFTANHNNPVECVSWYDAIMFCNKLSEKEKFPKYYNVTYIKRKGNNINSATVTISGGIGYRLPTDEQWLYAANGGNKSKNYVYSGSNNINEVAWYGENSEGKTHPVGLKKPNELNIYDMSGNVLEWNETKLSDELSDEKAYCGGGSWESHENSCEIGEQSLDDVSQRYYRLGFRVSRNIINGGK